MSPSFVLVLALVVAVAQGKCWPPPLQSCYNCTMDQVKQCAANRTEPFPTCECWPTWDESCCPSCWRYPECHLDWDKIPVCATGEVAKISLDTGCASCRTEQKECTFEDDEACRVRMKNESFPVCPLGVEPYADDECCVTCRKVKNPYCNKTSIALCHARMHYAQEGVNSTVDLLPLCNETAGETPKFDPYTCCRTCMPHPPHKPGGHKRGHPCHADDIRDCLEEMPYCEEGETPVKDDETQCCQSCKRRERNCTVEAIMECRANMRECAVGEVPSFVRGGPACCPSCRLPPPVCNPNCTEGFKCVRIHGEPGTLDTKCKRIPQGVHLRLRCLEHKRNLHLLNATLEEIKALLQEIVARFCDQNVNADRCEKYEDVIEQMEVIINKLEDHLELVIKVPDPDVGQDDMEVKPHNVFALFRESARAHPEIKLNALDGGAATVQLAVNDAEAGAGFTMEAVQTGGAHPAFTLSVLMLVALMGLVTLL